MNKMYLLALVLLVLCVMETQERSVGEIFYSLSGDFRKSFSSAGHKFVQAIKRQARTRRRRNRIRRRKTTTIAPGHHTLELPKYYQSTESSIGRNIELPVIPIPKFLSLYEWKNLQKPRFALKSDDPARSLGTNYTDGDATETLPDDDFDYFVTTQSSDSNII